MEKLKEVKDLLVIILTIIYNLTIVVGCSYVVFGLGFSGWWFLLAIMLKASYKRSDNE